MARARDPNRDKAFEVFKEHEGNITNRAIAEMLGVLEKTISAWKSRDKWLQQLNGDECSTTKEKCSTTKHNSTKSKSAQNEKSAVNSEVSDEDETVDLRMDELGVNEEELRVSGDFTDKQIQFISHYVKCWNATKAYQKSYGCSRTVALVNGPRLLGNARIKSEVERIRNLMTKDNLLDGKSLLQKWIDIAFADITDFVEFGSEQEVVRDFETGDVVLDANGNPKMRTYSYVNLKDDAEVDGTILTSVTLGKDGVGVKLADKMKALEYLSKHIYLLSDTEKTKFDNEQRKAKALAEKAEIEVETLKKNDGNQVTKVVFVDDIGGEEDDAN